MTSFLRVLFLIPTCYFSAMADKPCLIAATSISRSRYFSGTADLILHRHGYRTLLGKSAVECGNLCLSDTRCFSINFAEQGKLCELNGATASQRPSALVERSGGYYYGPEEPDAIQQLQSSHNGGGPPLHEHRSSALSECQRGDQHLCQPWELEQVYQAGNYSALQSGTLYWYSDVMSRVSVTSEGLTYQDLPRPLITNEFYGKEERDEMAKGCSALGAHLCDLEELKDAVLNGYSPPLFETWCFFSLEGRDVILYDDGCREYVGDECYEGLVVNTPRPHLSDRVYCCEARIDVSSPVLCCPGLVSARQPIITMETFAVGDRSGIVNGCSTLGAHPCTLAELKEAYLWGYRPPTRWLLFAEPDRDVTLFGNGCGEYTGDECYEGIVPNTPRPSPITEAFCCPRVQL